MPRWCVAAAVAFAGGRTVQLSPAAPESGEPYQGVVVTGGHDIDPVLYAEESAIVPHHDPERDVLESRVIDAALASNLPLLGICRGAQLLNARLGGSLHQNLRDHRRHTSHRRTILPLKTLLLEPDSHLYQLMGYERQRINSLHNQSINRLGAGLVVSARDLDGIVQAVEDRSRRYLLGVQWHPEFLLFLPAQQALFGDLVKAAREWQA